MTKQKKSTFETLFSLNVNENTEKKGKLTYLSWSWAWAQFMKHYPESTYGIIKTRDKDGVWQPYSLSSAGLMCETWVRTSPDEPKKTMWLPVMDNNNTAMKLEPYTYVTSWGKKLNVQAATMFEINSTLMRCLTKNLAMFGLGLYIYAGEDLPETEKQSAEVDSRKEIKAGTELFKKAVQGIKSGKGSIDGLLKTHRLSKEDLKTLTKEVNG